MIVNDVLARRLFNTEDPVGRCSTSRRDVGDCGVVGSVRRFALGAILAPGLLPAGLLPVV